MMRIDILTLFPEMVEPIISTSIIGRARLAGLVQINCHHIRDYTTDKHGRTDLPIYGGGKGMLLTPEPIDNAYNSIVEQSGSKPHMIYMTPTGKVFDQNKAVELAGLEHICILAGHYEGVDQRVVDKLVDEELSIGDYVLTSGVLPALVVTDAVIRLCPGVIKEESWQWESHSEYLLEHPHYTKPYEWEGREVPEVLVEGNHSKIEKWRREQSLIKTLENRPELLKKATLNASDLEFLKNMGYKE